MSRIPTQGNPPSVYTAASSAARTAEKYGCPGLPVALYRLRTDDEGLPHYI